MKASITTVLALLFPLISQAEIKITSEPAGLSGGSSVGTITRVTLGSESEVSVAIGNLVGVREIDDIQLSFSGKDLVIGASLAGAVGKTVVLQKENGKFRFISIVNVKRKTE